LLLQGSTKLFAHEQQSSTSSSSPRRTTQDTDCAASLQASPQASPAAAAAAAVANSGAQQQRLWSTMAAADKGTWCCEGIRGVGQGGWSDAGVWVKRVVHEGQGFKVFNSVLL
jgi:hypothetical protein